MPVWHSSINTICPPQKVAHTLAQFNQHPLSPTKSGTHSGTVQSTPSVSHKKWHTFWHSSINTLCLPQKVAHTLAQFNQHPLSPTKSGKHSGTVQSTPSVAHKKWHTLWHSSINTLCLPQKVAHTLAQFNQHPLSPTKSGTHSGTVQSTPSVSHKKWHTLWHSSINTLCLPQKVAHILAQFNQHPLSPTKSGTHSGTVQSIPSVSHKKWHTLWHSSINTLSPTKNGTHSGTVQSTPSVSHKKWHTLWHSSINTLCLPQKVAHTRSQQGDVIHPRLSGDMGMTTAIALDASFNLHSVSRILVAMGQICWYVKLGLITDVCVLLTSKLPHVLSCHKARQHTSELMSATMIFSPAQDTNVLGAGTFQWNCWCIGRRLHMTMPEGFHSWLTCTTFIINLQTSTVQSYPNMVNILQNTQPKYNTHPRSHMGWGMVCLVWVQSLTDIASTFVISVL